MDYHYTMLKKSFNISKIVTVHYFEYAKNFQYNGERHDFWEFVYVDKGSAEIQKENQWIPLEQGYGLFHAPNEFHNLRANGVVAPNLIVIAFPCNSTEMRFFKENVFALSDYEKHILANIIMEAKEVFLSPLDDPGIKKMKRKETVPFGCEQMIAIYLEQLLISIKRNAGNIMMNTTTLHRKTEDKILDDVLEYLYKNIHEKLVFQQVLDQIGISASGLKGVFKKKMGMGVMKYFTKMKMDAAKKMIREGNLNITQIASALGFDSVHLFSRRFRQLNGMSPTEYGKSVLIEFD